MVQILAMSSICEQSRGLSNVRSINSISQLVTSGTAYRGLQQVRLPAPASSVSTTEPAASSASTPSAKRPSSTEPTTASKASSATAATNQTPQFVRNLLLGSNEKLDKAAGVFSVFAGIKEGVGGTEGPSASGTTDTVDVVFNAVAAKGEVKVYLNESREKDEIRTRSPSQARSTRYSRHPRRLSRQDHGLRRRLRPRRGARRSGTAR